MYLSEESHVQGCQICFGDLALPGMKNKLFYTLGGTWGYNRDFKF